MLHDVVYHDDVNTTLSPCLDQLVDVVDPLVLDAIVLQLILQAHFHILLMVKCDVIEIDLIAPHLLFNYRSHLIISNGLIQECFSWHMLSLSYSGIFFGFVLLYFHNEGMADIFYGVFPQIAFFRTFFRRAIPLRYRQPPGCCSHSRRSCRQSRTAYCRRMCRFLHWNSKLCFRFA